MAAPATAVQQRAPAQAAAKPAAKKSKIPIWVWEAKTKAGEVRKGEMEAADSGAVNNRLVSLGLVPVKVKKKPLDLNIKIPGLGGVTPKDVLIFTRQFSTMI